MKLTFGGKLDRPNVCFLCETTPEPGSKVIDTERYFDGFPHNLRGRRYVCEKCVNSMVKFFDLADLATVERAQAEAQFAQDMLQGLKRRVYDLFEDLRQIAENPNILVEAGDVPKERPGSATVGDVPHVEADPGFAGVGEAEELSSISTDRSSAGGHSAAARTYSGASLSESPYAQ
jgi:hypothetical protein